MVRSYAPKLCCRSPDLFGLYLDSESDSKCQWHWITGIFAGLPSQSASCWSTPVKSMRTSIMSFSVYSTCWMETGRQAEQCYHKIHCSCRHNRLRSHKGWKDFSEHHDETGIELKYPLKLLGILFFFWVLKGTKKREHISCISASLHWQRLNLNTDPFLSLRPHHPNRALWSKTAGSL